MGNCTDLPMAGSASNGVVVKGGRDRRRELTVTASTSRAERRGEWPTCRAACAEAGKGARALPEPSGAVPKQGNVGMRVFKASYKASMSHRPAVPSEGTSRSVE